MTSPYWFTISQAAEACSVSKDTLRRALRAGKLPNSRRGTDTNRTYEIPLGDLTHAGFRIDPRRASSPTSNADVLIPAAREPVEDGAGLTALRSRVAALETQLAAAQTAADERAARIADLQMALSVLVQRPLSDRPAS